MAKMFNAIIDNSTAIYQILAIQFDWIVDVLGVPNSTFKDNVTMNNYMTQEIPLKRHDFNIGYVNITYFKYMFQNNILQSENFVPHTFL